MRDGSGGRCQLSNCRCRSSNTPDDKLQFTAAGQWPELGGLGPDWFAAALTVVLRRVIIVVSQRV